MIHATLRQLPCRPRSPLVQGLSPFVVFLCEQIQLGPLCSLNPDLYPVSALPQQNSLSRAVSIQVQRVPLHAYRLGRECSAAGKGSRTSWHPRTQHAGALLCGTPARTMRLCTFAIDLRPERRRSMPPDTDTLQLEML